MRLKGKKKLIKLCLTCFRENPAWLWQFEIEVQSNGSHKARRANTESKYRECSDLIISLEKKIALLYVASKNPPDDSHSHLVTLAHSLRVLDEWNQHKNSRKKCSTKIKISWTLLLLLTLAENPVNCCCVYNENESESLEFIMSAQRASEKNSHN